MTNKERALNAIRSNQGKFKTALELAKFLNVKVPHSLKLYELEKKDDLIYWKDGWRAKEILGE